jgi:hypothetical protein
MERNLLSLSLVAREGHDVPSIEVTFDVSCEFVDGGTRIFHADGTEAFLTDEEVVATVDAGGENAERVADLLTALVQSKFEPEN